MANSSDANSRYGLPATFAALTMLAGMGAGGGYMASHQEQDKARLFATEAAAAQGSVTRRATEEMNGQTQFYDLDVSFVSPDGASQKGSFRVPQYVWAMHDVGASIAVTYVKSQPAWFYIEGAPPQAANQEIPAKIAFWAAVAAAVFGLGFVISLVAAMRTPVLTVATRRL
jgi:hypothetical protein